MNERPGSRSMAWREAAGYETRDEIRFIQWLAATDPMKFYAYAETVHLRKRWGRVDARAVLRRVDQLLAARQPRMPLAA